MCYLSVSLSIDWQIKLQFYEIIIKILTLIKNGL